MSRKPHDGDLGAHRRRLPELAQLAFDERPRRRRQILGGKARGVVGRLFVRLLAGLRDLVANDPHLLVQEHLALRLLDALRHLGHDLLLEAEHLRLLGERLEQRREALLG